jgi:hypothetical protein
LYPFDRGRPERDRFDRTGPSPMSSGQGALMSVPPLMMASLCPQRSVVRVVVSPSRHRTSASVAPNEARCEPIAASAFERSGASGIGVNVIGRSIFRQSPCVAEGIGSGIATSFTRSSRSHATTAEARSLRTSWTSTTSGARKPTSRH